MERTRAHLSADDIVRYRGREMSPAELMSADTHLAACDVCHRQLIAWTDLTERVAASTRAFEDAVAAEPAHLTYEQLASLVDREISDIDREIVESHLEFCLSCETELRDLRELRANIAAGANQPIVDGPRKTSWREMFTSFWPAFGLPALGMMTLAFVATILLLSFLISIPLRKEISDTRARIAELETTNATLQERIGEVEILKSEIAILREDNDRLRLASEGRSIVALNDGGAQIVLDAQGKLSGVQADSRYAQAIREALKAESVKLPASLRELRGSSGTLMGSSQSGFNLVSPVGAVVEADRPDFRWTGLEGATSYTVTIFDASLMRISSGDTGGATEWTVPSQLARGKTYIWQVRAIKDGQEVVAPSPAQSKVKFKVLEASKLDEVNRARRAYSNSHLTMGLVYAEAGLIEESRREFEALVRANPQSQVARRLLASVQSSKR